jgi:hypothetical protein
VRRALNMNAANAMMRGLVALLGPTRFPPTRLNLRQASQEIQIVARKS